MNPEKSPTGSLLPATISPSINGWNAQYIESMHATWKQDKESVPKEWQDFFHGFELGNEVSLTEGQSDCIREAQTNVDSLIYHYRSAGHYAANLDPLGVIHKNDSHLQLQSFGLNETHLDELRDMTI